MREQGRRQKAEGRRRTAEGRRQRSGGLALLSFAFCLLPFALIAAQQPNRDLPAAVRTGTASISGVVLTGEDTPRPLRRAIVVLNGSGLQASALSVVTDDEGRFRFGSLPDGNFTLTASRPPYVQMSYGQKRPARGSGVPISVATGQQIAGITIKLPRGAVITGTTTDEVGGPRRGVQITLEQYRTVNGERILSRAFLPGVGPITSGSTTDDRGVFRLFGLPAGDYAVSAQLPPLQNLNQSTELRQVTAAELQWAESQLRSTGNANATAAAGAAVQTPPPPPGQSVGLAKVYYPGVLDSSAAAAITLAAGEERSGVDFAIALVPTAKIEGTIIGPDGQPPAGVSLTLISGSGDNTMSMGSSNFLRGQGQFVIPNLSPGDYRVMARTTTPSSMPTLINGAPAATRPVPAGVTPGLWAMAEVSVNGRDISGITLTLQPGMKLSGRIAFESKALTPPNPTAVRPFLTPQTPGAAGGGSALVHEDGTFEFSGIIPGKYRLNAGVAGAPPASGPAWIMRSAIAKGRDIADSAVEIAPGEDVSDVLVTFTDQPAEITGSLLDAAGRPTPEYYVVVFSTNPASWFRGGRRVRPPVRPASDGKFRVHGLAAGEYYMAALTEVDQQDLFDASFLEQIAASAIKITLAEGEKKVQDLRLAGSGSQ